MAALASREINPVLENPSVIRYGFLQRFALLRAHPRRIFFDMAVLPWEVYYLWQGQWGVALTLFVLGSAVSFISVSDADYAKIAETILGKIALLHLRPVNIFFQLAGLAFFIQGLLVHSTQAMLVGTSSLLIGHMVGWEKVHLSL